MVLHFGLQMGKKSLRTGTYITINNKYTNKSLKFSHFLQSEIQDYQWKGRNLKTNNFCETGKLRVRKPYSQKGDQQESILKTLTLKKIDLEE